MILKSSHLICNNNPFLCSGAVWVTKIQSEEETTGVFLVMYTSSIPRQIMLKHQLFFSNIHSGFVH